MSFLLVLLLLPFLGTILTVLTYLAGIVILAPWYLALKLFTLLMVPFTKISKLLN